jgi:hypothetical protein
LLHGRRQHPIEGTRQQKGEATEGTSEGRQKQQDGCKSIYVWHNRDDYTSNASNSIDASDVINTNNSINANNIRASEPTTAGMSLLTG